MNIAFINGSPKLKNSVSYYILQELNSLLKNHNNMICECCSGGCKLTETDIQKITQCNILIFAFPLYVDSIPSHLLSYLVEMESAFLSINKKDIGVYAISNCGFYEGHQNRIALDIMENWCIKTGLNWKQGLGIGGGAMLTGIKNVPIGHGPKKNLGKALKKLSENILENASDENIFITPNFPRFLYKFAAEAGWRKSIRKNGLSVKDLSR